MASALGSVAAYYITENKQIRRVEDKVEGLQRQVEEVQRQVKGVQRQVEEAQEDLKWVKRRQRALTRMSRRFAKEQNRRIYDMNTEAYMTYTEDH